MRVSPHFNKIFFLIACLSLGLSPCLTRAQQVNLPYAWAQKGGGTSEDTGRGIALDRAGNVYVTGRFIGSGQFGTQTLNSTSFSQDIFLVKYNAQGIVQWAQRAGGFGDDSGIAVGVDSAGNAYVAGYYDSFCSFSSSSITLTSQGDYDVFLAKYDPSGTLLWAKDAGGPGYDEASGLSVSAQGKAAVTGFFDNSLLAAPGITLSATGRRAYLVYYDTQGQPEWARTVGGPNGSQGRGAAFDGAGNVYVTGNTVTAGNNDGFITKLDSMGTEEWSRFMTGNGFDRSITVVTDGYGSLLAAGLFEGTTQFENTTLTSAGDYDSFLAKYDAMGNLEWVKSAGGAQRDYAISLAVDHYGNPMLTGFYTNLATFGNTQLQSTAPAGQPSIFRAWYDWMGNFLGVQGAGNSSDAVGYGIAEDGMGDTYVTGNFKSTVTFTPYYLMSSGSDDAFVARVSSSIPQLHPPRTTGLTEEVSAAAIVVFPNPAATEAKLLLNLGHSCSMAEVRLYDALGKQVCKTTVIPADEARAVIQFSLGNNTPGIYTLRILADGQVYRTKVVIR